MRKLFAALLCFVAAAWAVNIKLYLKDGSYQLVNDYKVEGDRVRFYTVERSEWEEIPLSMVDLKRTQAEATERKEELAHDAKVLSEEDATERAMRKEVMRIPQNPGVYWIDGEQTKPLKLAESVVHSDKRREVLKILSPIPAISGKATLEIEGAHSANVFTNRAQEFYIQLSDPERFGIAQLTSKNGVRIVENLTYQPITKEVTEEPTMVDIFREQLTPDGLYKIWPKENFAPGEYAVVQYTAGKLDIQVWDFAVKAAK